MHYPLFGRRLKKAVLKCNFCWPPRRLIKIIERANGAAKLALHQEEEEPLEFTLKQFAPKSDQASNHLHKILPSSWTRGRWESHWQTAKASWTASPPSCPCRYYCRSSRPWRPRRRLHARPEASVEWRGRLPSRP